MTQSNSMPIWQDVPLPSFEPIRADARYDVVVVGGGITGLSAAHFLKQAGVKVCVVERDRLGDGDSGHTTAHLTCVTDTRLAELAKRFGREQAALCWYAGSAAIDLIDNIINKHQIDCEFRRIPAYLHASLVGTRDESQELNEEVELARDLGFDVGFVDKAPVVEKPAMLIYNQARFHPRKYMAALVNLIDGGGSALFENTEVSKFEADPFVVVAGDHRIECDYVIVATHVPLMGTSGLLKATLLQSRLAAYSTYVIGAHLPLGTADEVSLWDTSDPYYYLRVDRADRHDRVIFGGCDHKTGQRSDPEARYRELELLLRRLLPAAIVDHRWSGQIVKSTDGMPLIGESEPRQFVATGFNGNGMTFGTLAGAMARDVVMRVANPWQDLFSLDRKKVRGGIWNYLRENLDYPYYMLADRISGAKQFDPEDLKPGQGELLKIEGKRVACARDRDGHLHQVSAVCTHLGCLVHFNRSEQTWDCPCHGSRFRLSGEVLAGPAETPLEPVESPRASQHV